MECTKQPKPTITRSMFCRVVSLSFFTFLCLCRCRDTVRNGLTLPEFTSVAREIVHLLLEILDFLLFNLVWLLSIIRNFCILDIAALLTFSFQF